MTMLNGDDLKPTFIRDLLMFTNVCKGTAGGEITMSVFHVSFKSTTGQTATQLSSK